ncbi:MAG: MarR family transcriptional regulator [Burkholderiales bacterium]|nr:MarR family transcriptional regulator [Burkholderiales bacterium]
MALTALSRACADDVLEVLPDAMDTIRLGMRSQLDNRLSVPQFRCLNYIDHSPGASVGAVAAFLGVTMPTASAMVDRLARAGHVLASSSAADRRRSTLHISASGKTLLEQVRAETRHELASRLARRPAEDLRAIRDGLAALRRALA